MVIIVPFDTMKRVISQKPIRPDDLIGKEYLMFKILGFGDIDAASKVDRYVFTIDQDYIRGLIIVKGRHLKTMPKWIKKTSKKDDKLDKLMEKYRVKFAISKSDFKRNYELIRNIAENNLVQFLRELGEDEKTFRSFGIEVEKATVTVGLDRWF